MESSLHHLLEQTIRLYFYPEAQLITYTTQPMRQDEQGYSGASLARHDLIFVDPRGEQHAVTLITKEALLRERRVLHLLTSQGHCVPFSHTLDLTTDGPALICQQDVSAEALPTPPDSQRQVARCLARIHTMNLRRAEDLAWLPPADHAYFQDVILADYREQLALASQRPGFAVEYADVIGQMEWAVEPFLSTMDALWSAGNSLTLIHADMMDDHVLTHAGQPYVIDWGQARYGSFYLDLPNFFTPDTVLFYRDALAELGLDIPTDEFMRCYGQAGRYPGFKYIGFLLSLWGQGQLDALNGPLLQQLIHGTPTPPSL